MFHDRLNHADRSALESYEDADRFGEWTRQLEAQRAAEEQESYDLEKQYQKDVARRADDLQWYRQLGQSRVAKLTQRLAVCRDATQYAEMAADQAVILTMIERIEVQS